MAILGSIFGGVYYHATVHRSVDVARHWAMTCCLVFAAAFGFAREARAQKSPRARDAVTRAREHLTAERFPEAINELQAAVRFEPKFALGWYLLASSHRRAGDCDRAVSTYRRYLELRPGEAEPHYGIGLCLQTVGDPMGARDQLREYIRLEKNAEAQSFVADAQKRVTDLDAALASAEKTSTPETPVTRDLAEARRLRDQKHFPEAVAAYQKWLTTYAKAPDVLNAKANAELGALLILSKDFSAAVSPLKIATRLTPALAAAWYNLGFALRQLGQLPEAAAAYLRYVTFKPTDPDPYYGLGQMLAALDRTDEALSAYRSYVNLETRGTEHHWVVKVQAEITRLMALTKATGAPAKKADATNPTKAITPPNAAGPTPVPPKVAAPVAAAAPSTAATAAPAPALVPPAPAPHPAAVGGATMPAH